MRPQSRYHEIYDESGLPLILFQYPDNTKATYDLDTQLEIAGQDGVFATKNGVRNMRRWYTEIPALRAAYPELQILSCHDEYLLPTMFDVDGLLVGYGNVAPEPLIELIAAGKASDYEPAHAIHERLLPVTKNVFHRGSHMEGTVALKWGSASRGIPDDATVRTPLLPLPDGAPAEIAGQLSPWPASARSPSRRDPLQGAAGIDRPGRLDHPSLSQSTAAPTGIPPDMKVEEDCAAHRRLQRRRPTERTKRVTPPPRQSLPRAALYDQRPRPSSRHASNDAPFGATGPHRPGIRRGRMAVRPRKPPTAVQAGSGYQYALIWVIVVSTILMIFLTDMAVRLGIKSDASLIPSIKDHLGGWVGVLAGIGIFLITLCFSVGNAVGSGLGPRCSSAAAPSCARSSHRRRRRPPAPPQRLPRHREGARRHRRADGHRLHRLRVHRQPRLGGRRCRSPSPTFPGDAWLPIVALVGTNFSINAAFYTSYGTKERARTEADYRDVTVVDTIPGIIAPGVMTALVIVVAASVLGVRPGGRRPSSPLAGTSSSRSPARSARPCSRSGSSAPRSRR